MPPFFEDLSQSEKLSEIRPPLLSQKIIEKVKSNVNLPLIVGGGIKTKQQIDEAHRSGADIVVIGNALEASPELINTLV